MTEKKEKRKGREGERGRARERKGESLSSVVFKYSQKYLNAEGHAKIFVNQKYLNAEGHAKIFVNFLGQ